MSQNWDDYVYGLLSSDKYLREVSLVDGQYNSDEVDCIPSIIRASVLLLEQMLSKGSKKNIVVFPEDKYSHYLFAVSKIIYNITSGRIPLSYDLESFPKGTILKAGNCCVRFEGIFLNKTGKRMIKVACSDLDYTIPLDDAPFFSQSKSKKLSSSKKWSTERLILPSCDQTHASLDSFGYPTQSVLYVSKSSTQFRDWFSTLRINGRPSKTIPLLYGKRIDSKGEYDNLLSGQYDGQPAFFICDEMWQALQVLEDDKNIQSVIIDVVDDKFIEENREFIDQIKAYNIPVVLTCSSKYSSKLYLMEESGFSTWKWNSNTISDFMIESDFNTELIFKCKKCKQQKIDSLLLPFPPIDDSLQLIYKHKKDYDSGEMSLPVAELHDKLLTLLIVYMRLGVLNPLPSKRKQYVELIDECSSLLTPDLPITEEEYHDYKKVIENLTPVIYGRLSLPKAVKVKELLDSSEKSLVIIPDNADKHNYKEELAPCLTFFAPSKNPIFIMTISEFLEMEDNDFSEYKVFVLGWYRANLLKDVFYSYKTSDITLLLYQYENDVWASPNIRAWNRLNDNLNTEKAVRFFGPVVNELQIEKSNPEKETIPNSENDLDAYLQTIRLKKYTSSSSSQVYEKAEVIPVYFESGNVIFYRKTSNKILCMKKDSLKVKSLSYDLLEPSDFIIHSSGRDQDLIREIADKILKTRGEEDARSLAGMWKESLKLATSFNSSDVVSTIKAAGCKRGVQTIKSWLTNDNLIIPQDKNDLSYIAKALKDDLLQDSVDDVYKAGQEVIAAHIEAGKFLARSFRDKMTAKLTNPIDFNLKDTILDNPELSNFGEVRVLKITDIGSETIIPAFRVGHLLGGEDNV